MNRFLGVYHHFEHDKNGTVRLRTEGEKYLKAVADRYMQEAGVKHLAFAPSPSIGDKVDDTLSEPGVFAKTAASHLMSVLYVARLVRADLVTTTSFLARRVAPGRWTKNEDRRLHRLMQYIHHHASLCLVHELQQSDRDTMRLVFSPDAELGGDAFSTKPSGGFWLHLESEDGRRRWPLCWSCKRAGHTSTATADSEVWIAVGAAEMGLKKEVIPILQQLEATLGRLVLLQCREDNTQCIAAIRRGYSPALRHLKRHINLGLGFTHEVFHGDSSDPTAPVYWASMVYCPSKEQLGDWMTKELAPKDFQAALEMAGYERF